MELFCASSNSCVKQLVLGLCLQIFGLQKFTYDKLIPVCALTLTRCCFLICSLCLDAILYFFFLPFTVLMHFRQEHHFLSFLFSTYISRPHSTPTEQRKLVLNICNKYKIQFQSIKISFFLICTKHIL